AEPVDDAHELRIVAEEPRHVFRVASPVERPPREDGQEMRTRAHRDAAGLARLAGLVPADQPDAPARSLEAKRAAERLEVALQPRRNGLVPNPIHPISDGSVGGEEENPGRTRDRPQPAE